MASKPPSPAPETNVFLEYPAEGQPLPKDSLITFVLEDEKRIYVSTDGKTVKVSSDGNRNALIVQGQATNVIVVKPGDYL